MGSSLSQDKEFCTARTDASSLFSLLESGLHCARQRRYVEGIIFFALAREQLSPDQAQLAAALDALIQSYTRYSRAQEELIQASKRVAKEDAEQQVQLAALVDLLPALTGETKESPHLSIQSPTSKDDGDKHLLSLLRSLPEELNCEKSPTQQPQLSCEDTVDSQPELSSQSFNETGTTLSALSITCFGHFEVRRLGNPIVLCSSRNGQAILRYLVAQPGYCASVDKLMAVLWPEDEPEVAQNKLYIAMSALRRSLTHSCKGKAGYGYIICKNRKYYLGPANAIHTDVDDFLQFYQLGQQKCEAREAFYEKACSLYTGSFLVEDLYADWSFLQRERLSQIYLTMCGVLTEHYLQIKSYEDATKWANAILKENRYDETAYRQLMQIYAAQGRRSEALQQYHRCEQLLREELGISPLPETMLALHSLLTEEPSLKNKAET